MSVMNRWLQRTTRGDQIAMCVFFLGGIFLLYYELSLVAAFNHSDWSTGYIIHFCLGVFFAVSIYGNWLMMFLTDITGKGVVFPTGPAPPGWRYCDTCIANSPPRSHHCPLCKVCVLKRDHHCWFAGTCVGYANHRYFFAMCVQIVVVGVYCNVYNWSYVWDIKGELTFLNLLSFVLPHVTGAMGYESWFTFYITTLSMIGFTLTFMFSWLLQIQLTQIIHGQTRYERKKKITDFDQGLWANFEDMLGHRLFLVLLCPWLPSRLPGDGIKFYSQSQKAS